MTGSPENYKGQYASLKFDPYKFREFPKTIYVEGKLVGTANNLMEEKELYAAHGVERGDIDPMTSLRDENAELKAKLAQFESGQPAVGRSPGVRTNTVEMLPAGTGVGDPEGFPPDAPYSPPSSDDLSRVAAPKPGQLAGPKPNPLLAGKPGPQGGAPQVNSPIKDGH